MANGRPRLHTLSEEQEQRLNAAKNMRLKGSNVAITITLPGPLAIDVLDTMTEGETLKDFIRTSVRLTVERRRGPHSPAFVRYMEELGIPVADALMWLRAEVASHLRGEHPGRDIQVVDVEVLENGVNAVGEGWADFFALSIDNDGVVVVRAWGGGVLPSLDQCRVPGTPTP